MSDVIEEMQTHGLQGQKSFTMKNSVKAFNILSDSLYMNKALAVIRELSTNAYDAHISNGTKDVPFEIHLPNDIEPFFWIRDYGTGLAHDDVLNLYTTYFDSTKTDSADATGALGLGSKSPFAIVDDFTVVSYQNEKAKTYFAYKNEEGFPCISFISENEANGEKNGIKIQFAVRKDKFHDFQINSIYALYHFDPTPTILNAVVKMERETISLSGNGWEIASTNKSKVFLADSPLIVMARVSYPLDAVQFEHFLEEDELYLLHLLGVPLRIYVDNRSIDHTPSRENLQYTKKTVRTIKEKLKEIYQTLMLRINEEFALCENINDVISRCGFLSRLSKDNVNVEPWKSNIRTFNPREFADYITVFNYDITINSCKNLPLKVNLWKMFNRPEIKSKTSIFKLNVPEFYGLSSKNLASVLSRLEVKSFNNSLSLYGSILTDEEINTRLANAIKNNSDIGTFDEIKYFNIHGYLTKMKMVKNHEKFSCDFRPNFKHIVDDFGKTVSSHVNRDSSIFTISLHERCQDIVLVIDDYPKGANALLRTGFARAKTREFTDYVIFSNASRTGGKFNEHELECVSAIAKIISKNFGYKIIKASEIEVPDCFNEVIKKTSMKKDNYCAFNVLRYGGILNSSVIDHFKEVPADKMPEDFELPDFNSCDVVYIRRNRSHLELFGNEGDNEFITEECKVDDSDFEIVEELVRFFSVFAGKDILENKTLVTIKTKAQFEKAKKGNWKSFSDLLKETCSSLSDEQVYQMIVFCGISVRQGICNSIKYINNTAKIFANVKKIGKFDHLSEYDIRNGLSAISGVFAFIGAAKASGPDELETVETLIANFKNDLKDNQFSEIFYDIAKYFELNHALKNKGKYFTKFSARRVAQNHYITGGARSALFSPEIILHIVKYCSPKKFSLQIEKFILQCIAIVEKYPLLLTYSTDHTHNEQQWLANNIFRSKESFPHLIKYINMIEGE